MSRDSCSYENASLNSESASEELKLAFIHTTPKLGPLPSYGHRTCFGGEPQVLVRCPCFFFVPPLVSPLLRAAIATRREAKRSKLAERTAVSRFGGYGTIRRPIQFFSYFLSSPHPLPPESVAFSSQSADSSVLAKPRYS